MGTATFSLRCQPENRPDFSFPAIKHAVVETMRLPLPELDTIGDNSEAAPERRTRNPVVPEARLHAEKFLFEKRSPGNFCALRRCPRAQPAFARTGLKIFVRFTRRHFLHASLDAQLARECRPVKYERGARIRAELSCLAAVVVGV